jgi:broad specificity phosphatase PhoE
VTRPDPDAPGAAPRTVVHFLRHGEVENPTKVLYGRLPGFRLSPLGEQMAQVATKALADRDITVVISSPLERARQTAEPIAAHFGLEVDIDERLIESENFFEGKRIGVGDGALRDPRNWHMLRNPFRPSWGEAYVEVAARMHAALLDAGRKAEGHEAVCVSHQLPIWTLRRHL